MPCNAGAGYGMQDEGYLGQRFNYLDTLSEYNIATNCILYLLSRIRQPVSVLIKPGSIMIIVHKESYVKTEHCFILNDQNSLQWIN
jgi:hypothetical protein